MKTQPHSSAKEHGRKPTLSDVAKAAGVSYATADRVINERGNVAEKSVRKVQEAMAALGYVRNMAAANLSRQRTCRLAFLIPKGRNAFFSRMRAHLDSAVAHLAAEQTSVDLIEIDAFAIGSLTQSLHALQDAAYDGLAVVGLQSDELSEPLRALHTAGTVIVSLVSDLPVDTRAAYIGIDNIAAGRTAARLLGMAHAGKPGRVQLIAGSLKARDHSDRLTGFRQVIEQDYPTITLLEPIMTQDQAGAVDEAVKQALQADPPISALYNVGAGNSGLVTALEHDEASERVFCLVHELVAHTHLALQENLIDIVIDQRPDVEVNRALSILKALIDGRDMPPLQELVPTIYVRDNIPSIIPDISN